MYRLGCGAYQVYSSNDPRLTSTYLTLRSNSLPNAFKLDFFLTSSKLFLILFKRKSLFPLDMLRYSGYN